MTLMRPWPRGHHVRSPYGYRIHPISGKRKLHRGLDIGYDGDIYAPADGTVVHKGANLNKSTGGGYTLRLRHENPRVYTVYYHLREPSPLPVGARVRQGEVIGHTGTTGASTGIHLHFETRKSPGTWGTDFDPMRILSTEHALENPRLNENVLARPSMLNRVSPGLASMSRGWMARGAHYLRGRGIR